MEVLQGELAKVQADATLAKGMEDVDRILDQLLAARESIAASEALRS